MRRFRAISLAFTLIFLSAPSVFTHPTHFVNFMYSLVPALETNLMGGMYSFKYFWTGAQYGSAGDGRDMVFVSQSGLAYGFTPMAGILGGISFGMTRNCNEEQEKKMNLMRDVCVNNTGASANSLVTSVGLNVGLSLQFLPMLGALVMYDTYDTTPAGSGKGSDGLIQLGINYHFDPPSDD